MNKKLTVLWEQYEKEANEIISEAEEVKKAIGERHHKSIDASTRESLAWIKAKYFDKIYENGINI